MERRSIPEFPGRPVLASSSLTIFRREALFSERWLIVAGFDSILAAGGDTEHREFPIIAVSHRATLLDPSLIPFTISSGYTSPKSLATHRYLPQRF